MPTETLTAELYWLTLTVLMTGLMWIPYILNRMLEQGIGFAMWDPQGETKTEIAWAERMARAHNNAVENLIIFAPLVLTLHAINKRGHNKRGQRAIVSNIRNNCSLTPV